MSKMSKEDVDKVVDFCLSHIMGWSSKSVEGAYEQTGPSAVTGKTVHNWIYLEHEKDSNRTGYKTHYRSAYPEVWKYYAAKEFC